jgi:hypothetical protein
MNAGEFTRRRERIERETRRKDSWRKRALQQLVREAQAVAIIVERHLVGWQLPNGQNACIKRRYNCEATAMLALTTIQRADGHHTKPIRSYPCAHCGGWHLTSQQHVVR